VAVALTLPDYNQVLAKLNGRLLPFGWLRVLRERRTIDEIRVFALGVKPGFEHTGVAAALYAHIWRTVQAHGISRAETGWVLETNRAMNSAMRSLGGDIVKRYRIYQMPLS
jgi:GNAT superfamily N-acetyltransferase